MTKDQMQVLTEFAKMGVPSSKWEAFGHTAGPHIDDTIAALVKAGLLVALPYSETRDEYGGTRFEVTAAGLAALGRESPTPPAKLRGGVVTSVNGKHRRAGS